MAAELDSIFMLRDFVIGDRLDDIVEDGSDLVFRKDGNEVCLSTHDNGRPPLPPQLPLPLATTHHRRACDRTDAGSDGDKDGVQE